MSFINLNMNRPPKELAKSILKKVNRFRSERTAETLNELQRKKFFPSDKYLVSTESGKVWVKTGKLENTFKPIVFAPLKNTIVIVRAFDFEEIIEEEIQTIIRLSPSLTSLYKDSFRVYYKSGQIDGIFKINEYKRYIKKPIKPDDEFGLINIAIYSATVEKHNRSLRRKDRDIRRHKGQKGRTRLFGKTRKNGPFIRAARPLRSKYPQFKITNRFITVSTSELRTNRFTKGIRDRDYAIPFLQIKAGRVRREVKK